MPLLSSAIVTAKDASPDRWMIFLHGILGSGANWRTFAKQVTSARPEIGALLVDLRLHGDSLAGFAPPHTLEAAATDIVETIASMPAVRGNVRAILGHSFGGKVGIELARQLGAGRPLSKEPLSKEEEERPEAEREIAKTASSDTKTTSPVVPETGRRSGAVLATEEPLEHLFVIDSTPSARPDHRGSSGVKHIVELLTELPTELPDRNAFTAWIEERGVSRPTAMWLAMNVRPIPNTTRFAFRIDVPAVRTMMDDYFQRDLWPIIESPPREMTTHLIVGGKSEVVDESDRDHAVRCPLATVDVIEDAGHWVHVDAPQRLLDLVLGYL